MDISCFSIKVWVSRYPSTVKRIKDVNFEVEFSPERLAKLGLSKMIFDIIPKSKSTVIENYRSVFNDFIFRKLSREEKLKREELAIGFLPYCFAGELSKAVFNSAYRDNASMFDLINVFTEHAKESRLQSG